jgi:galactokinase
VLDAKTARSRFNGKGKRERKILMSEVHEAITAHIQKQHAAIKRFVQLEAERERYIDEAVALCQNGLPFTVTKINEVTKEMNELAKHGAMPQRKYVTVEMVKEYVERLTKQGGTK